MRCAAAFVTLVFAMAHCVGHASPSAAATDAAFARAAARPPPPLPDLVLSDLILSLGPNKSDVNHGFWFQKLFRTSLSQAEAHCLQNGTVYHAPSRSCHFLYLQGPCRATEWLVMEGHGDGRGLWATCARRPCAPGFDFLTEQEEGQRLCVREADACSHKSDAHYRAFKYSLQGEGRCACKGFRLPGPDGRCHLLFERGPCPPGEMLAPRYSASLETMHSVCVAQACPGADARTYRVVVENGTLFQNCASGEHLKCLPTFDPIFSSWVDLSVPLCVDLIRAAVTISTRPAGCVVVGGRCSTPVVRSALPYDWDVEEGDDLLSDRSAATSKAAASPRLRRHLSPFALYSSLFFH